MTLEDFGNFLDQSPVGVLFFNRLDGMMHASQALLQDRGLRRDFCRQTFSSRFSYKDFMRLRKFSHRFFRVGFRAGFRADFCAGCRTLGAHSIVQPKQLMMGLKHKPTSTYVCQMLDLSNRKDSTQFRSMSSATLAGAGCKLQPFTKKTIPVKNIHADNSEKKLCNFLTFLAKGFLA